MSALNLWYVEEARSVADQCTAGEELQKGEREGVITLIRQSNKNKM